MRSYCNNHHLHLLLISLLSSPLRHYSAGGSLVVWAPEVEDEEVVCLDFVRKVKQKKEPPPVPTSKPLMDFASVWVILESEGWWRIRINDGTDPVYNAMKFYSEVYVSVIAKDIWNMDAFNLGLILYGVHYFDRCAMNRGEDGHCAVCSTCMCCLSSPCTALIFSLYSTPLLFRLLFTSPLVAIFFFSPREVRKHFESRRAAAEDEDTRR